jgi:hypothetical protein
MALRLSQLSGLILRVSSFPLEGVGVKCVLGGSAADRSPLDRLEEISKLQEIEVWTKFDFPGRGSMHSPLKWSREHFSGVDFDHKSKSKGIWRFQSKKWALDVDEELANYDFL